MGLGDRTVEVPLLAEETVAATAFGAVGHTTGGKLLVTDQRVIFQPWDMGLAASLIKYGCKALQVPHASAVNFVVARLVSVVAATAEGVGGLVAADAEGHAGLFSLPKLVLRKDDGTTATFGVVVSPTTPNVSPKNNVARDELLTTIRRLLLP